MAQPAVPSASTPLVEMSGITKRFGGVLACDDVDLTVGVGEVHALLGENGAGKSTLVNILAGVITDYRGQIFRQGRPISFAGPSDAQAAGIATIHQELDLVLDLTIAENMFLGREPRTTLRTIDLRRMRRESTAQLSRLGIALDVRRSVRSLRVGERQLVEIARALLLDTQVLIMDEPTASLADAEVARLFETINGLRSAGVGVVYISHRMDEIENIADRATVLRNGTLAGTVIPTAVNRDEVISLMVGSRMAALFGASDQAAELTPSEAMDPSEATDPGETTDPVARDRGTAGGGSALGRRRRAIDDEPQDEPLLSVHDLHYRRRWPVPGRTDPQGIHLDVRAGEIVGLAGLMGAGRTELLETLYGAADGGRITGTIRLAGRIYRPVSPGRALGAGIAFVPEDRRGSGLVLEHSVAHNLVLAGLKQLCSGGIVRAGREKAAVRRQMESVGVKAASSRIPVGTLSGGNQQKVVFGRQLLTGPRLLMLDEPTRGVDIGAKAEIYRLLKRLAAEGRGVLLASSELPELLNVCDRIIVLRAGHVAAELESGCSQDDILTAAMGPGTITEHTDGPSQETSPTDRQENV